MNVYTIAELAKKVGVSPRVVKQWEKEFGEFVTIPRTKQGARIYTDEQLAFFRKIKTFSDQKWTKHNIRNFFEEEQEKSTALANDLSLVGKKRTEAEKIVMDEEIIDPPLLSRNETVKTLQNFNEELTENLGNYTTKPVKEEFSNEVRQTSEALHQLVFDMETYMEQVKDFTVASTIELAQSLEQLTESSEQNASDIYEKLESMEDSLQKEQEYLENERRCYQQEIIEREKAFREFVLTFRQSAITEAKKPKKWWKFWSIQK